MKTEVLRSDHPIALRHAADILQNGGLVAFPTDTVYGLATLPFHSEFVERLYSAKGRSTERAIAILLGDISQLKQVAQDLKPEVLSLAKRFWPGPLTLVVPKLPELPEEVSPYPTVGVRIPDHPVALALLRQVGPLAVTSANLSGKENANTADEVMRQLQGRIHLIIDGGVTPGGIPSTVVDVTGQEPAVLREGPISLEEIRLVMAR